MCKCVCGPLASQSSSGHESSAEWCVDANWCGPGSDGFSEFLQKKNGEIQNYKWLFELNKKQTSVSKRQHTTGTCQRCANVTLHVNQILANIHGERLAIVVHRCIYLNIKIWDFVTTRNSNVARLGCLSTCKQNGHCSIPDAAWSV